MNIKAGVRIRSLSSAERQLGSKVCVEVTAKTVRLFSLDQTEEKHRVFSFDYVLQPQDKTIPIESALEKQSMLGSGCEDSEDGGQQSVFGQIGGQMLDDAWEGFNCCLFAYGQSGSGKSRSIFGRAEDEGFIGRFGKELFGRIDKDHNSSTNFQVKISMMRIYSNKLHDLLVPIQQQGQLSVKNHKIFGIYAKGVTQQIVKDYESLEALIQRGLTNLAHFHFSLNLMSYRTDVIVQLELRQVFANAHGKRLERRSLINFVDLSGSERVRRAGMNPGWLKEAALICKSSSILGHVIQALSERVLGKRKIAFIPYRESSLTYLLQNAFGGNCKTFCLCTISPASDKFQQTLSTLRFCNRVRTAQNNPVVNEVQFDKMRNLLTKEYEMLYTQLINVKNSFLTQPNHLKLRRLSSNLKSEIQFISNKIKDYSDQCYQSQKKMIY